MSSLAVSPDEAAAEEGDFALDPATTYRVADVMAIVNGSRVTLGAAAEDVIRRSRRVIDSAVAAGHHIYGTTANMGHNKDRKVDGDLSAYQTDALLRHDGAFGPDLPEQVGRATLAVRSIGFTKGGSGVRPELVQAFLDLLNHGVNPLIPEISSVGAADLMAMAVLGKVILGYGPVRYQGQIIPAAAALSQAGLEPFRLASREGSAIICSNAFATGYAALVIHRAQRVAALADLCAALSLEAVSGNLSVLHPRVAEFKRVAGQADAAQHVRGLLAGSFLHDPGTQFTVQDPLSFRVIPQVHGALRQVVATAEAAVDIQINAADENPVISIADDEIIHNGNFHPIYMALCVDAIRPALVHVAQLAERRMNHVVFQTTGDPARTTGHRRSIPAWGLLGYAAAARLGELRHLAAPATQDIPPLDLNIEDHATNAPLAVRLTDRALDLIEDILVVELLTATGSLLDEPSARRLGAGTSVAVQGIRAITDPFELGQRASDLHRTLRAAVLTEILDRVEHALPQAG